MKLTRSILAGIACFAVVCAFAVAGASAPPHPLLFAMLALTFCAPIILPLARTPRSIFETRRAGLA